MIVRILSSSIWDTMCDQLQIRTQIRINPNAQQDNM